MLLLCVDVRHNQFCDAWMFYECLSFTFQLLPLTIKITSVDHKSHFRWPWKSLPLCLKVTSVLLESHFRCAWKSLPLTIKVTSADHKSHFRCAWKSAQVTFVVLKSHLKSLPLCLVSEGGISILSQWKEEFLRFKHNFPSL